MIAKLYIKEGAVLVCLLAGACFIVIACGGRGTGTVSIGPGTRYMNGTGSNQRVVLPDKSELVLGSGSEIRLWTGYGTNNRELDLDGMALFTIRNTVTGPFTVHTRNLRIEVLGTRFLVDGFRKNAGEEVDLLEGKLRVSKTYHSDTDNEPELLTAGEMVMINRDIDLMEKEKMESRDLEKVRAME